MSNEQVFSLAANFSENQAIKHPNNKQPMYIEHWAMINEQVFSLGANFSENQAIKHPSNKQAMSIEQWAMSKVYD